MKAVLDPNVVISGLISRQGAPAEVLSAWREGRFEIIVSPLLLEELTRALGYPKLRQRLSADDAELAVRWLADGATHAQDATEPPPVLSTDAGDDYLIALAFDQKAALVSGDRHLLELKGQIPVFAPREFIDVLVT